MLLQIQQLTKSYGGREIFSDLNFTIGSGKKIALVGRNGVGKSTLLNILSGVDPDYDGKVIHSPSYQIGYLTQDISLPTAHTLFEECLSHFSDLLKVKDQLTNLESMISKEPNDLSLQEKYGYLLHSLENEDGYNIENRVEQVLTGLGFSNKEWHRSISSLSGGEQRRGLLGKLLLNKFNLLILDEPTNHLDIFSIKWLEGFLKEYKSAILMVSHDRQFIDRLVDEIYDLEGGYLHRYAGNFKFYISEKERRFATQKKLYDLQQQKIKSEEEFIRRNIAGQKTKQAQSRRKALEKLDRVELPKRLNKLSINLSHEVSSQKNIIKVNQFSKAFGERVIIDSLSLKIEKGDKIGLIGRNGCGKSTLIKALVEDQPTQHSGDNSQSILRNQHIKIGYFDQGNHHLDETQSVFDTVFEKNPKLTNQQIRNILSLFQFRGDDVFKLVNQLSGGERTRLALLKTILIPNDFLILDEPTNHLDLQTRKLLGEALLDYPGTILVISHDRSFLDQFVNKIMLIADGKGHLFVGNYLENKEKIAQTIQGKENTQSIISIPETEKHQKKNVNMFKVQKLESKIADLEKEKEKLVAKMQDDSIYSNYDLYRPLKEKLKQLEAQISDKYSEWESYH